MNLLKIKHIGGLFKARWFPIVPQLVTLTVFVLLVAGSLGVTTDDPDLAYWLRNTNLSNLVVWSYWWPVIIIAAIFVGRLWCIVCPVELITYWAGRIGLRQQVPRIGFISWHPFRNLTLTVHIIVGFLINLSIAVTTCIV